MHDDNSTFTRKGADLLINKEITFMQALAGVNFTFTNLNGRTIRVTNKIGEVVKQGSKMTLLNYGMLFTKIRISTESYLSSSKLLGQRNSLPHK